MPKKETALKIIPLGGLDGIGKNMTVFEYGNDMVMIDAGLMFPDARLLVIGEHEAAVDQHRALAALPLLAVQAYFSKSPQRGDGKMPFRHVNSLNIFPGRGRPSGRTTHLNKSHGKTARIRRGPLPKRAASKKDPAPNGSSPDMRKIRTMLQSTVTPSDG